MPDEENKILKFPEPPPEDKTLWECKACNHKITESMEKAEAEGSKVLPLNLVLHPFICGCLMCLKAHPHRLLCF